MFNWIFADQVQEAGSVGLGDVVVITQIGFGRISEVGGKVEKEEDAFVCACG